MVIPAFVLSGQLRTTCRNLLNNRRMGLDPGTGFCKGCFYTSEGGMFAGEINTVVQSAGSGGVVSCDGALSMMETYLIQLVPGSGFDKDSSDTFGGWRGIFGVDTHSYGIVMTAGGLGSRPGDSRRWRTWRRR